MYYGSDRSIKQKIPTFLKLYQLITRKKQSIYQPIDLNIIYKRNALQTNQDFDTGILVWVLKLDIQKIIIT